MQKKNCNLKISGIMQSLFLLILFISQNVQFTVMDRIVEQYVPTYLSTEHDYKTARKITRVGTYFGCNLAALLVLKKAALEHNKELIKVY